MNFLKKDEYIPIGFNVFNNRKGSASNLSLICFSFNNSIYFHSKNIIIVLYILLRWLENLKSICLHRLSTFKKQDEITSIHTEVFLKHKNP